MVPNERGRDGNIKKKLDHPINKNHFNAPPTGFEGMNFEQDRGSYRHSARDSGGQENTSRQNIRDTRKE